MSLRIVSTCVNCWACIDVCPTGAVFDTKPHFRIDPRKCTECEGEHADAQCASICPIEGAIVNALGEPINPPGSLTGIPTHVLARAVELGYIPGEGA